jgi:hypothetical protein
MLAFSVAFERWMKANDDEPFPPFADAALSDLQARAAELVLPARAENRRLRREAGDAEALAERSGGC